jgi:hypothetical protein
MQDQKTGRFLPSKKYNHDLDGDEIERMYVQEKIKVMTIARKVGSYPKKIQKILKHRGVEFRKKSCYLSGPENPRFTGHEEIQGTYLASVKNKAKSRGLEFSVTNQYLWNLFLEQDRKCAYSGLKIFFARTNLEHINGDYTASLDRIDSSKGYIEGNVQWLHKRVNIMKGNMEQQEFLDFCEAITFQNKNQEIQKTFSHTDRK